MSDRTSEQQMHPNMNRRVTFDCFWPTGCSDSKRCNAHGSCVAAAQSQAAQAEQQSSNPILAAEINALPKRVRQYIHDLETNYDPAGDKWRILALEQNIAGLTADNERLHAELLIVTKDRDTLLETFATTPKAVAARIAERRPVSASSEQCDAVGGRPELRAARQEIERLTALVDHRCNYPDCEKHNAMVVERLRGALNDLIRGYVNTLENGRDRIRQLGGDCDPLDVMERGDPHLRKAREALERSPDETDAGADANGITDEDAANIGRALMERLPKGYCYSDSPTEIVTDQANRIHDLRKALDRMLTVFAHDMHGDGAEGDTAAFARAVLDSTAVEAPGAPVHYGSDGRLHLGEGPDGRRAPEETPESLNAAVTSTKPLPSPGGEPTAAVEGVDPPGAPGASSGSRAPRTPIFSEPGNDQSPIVGYVRRPE